MHQSVKDSFIDREQRDPTPLFDPLEAYLLANPEQPIWEESLLDEEEIEGEEVLEEDR